MGAETNGRREEREGTRRGGKGGNLDPTVISKSRRLWTERGENGIERGGSRPIENPGYAPGQT